MSKYNHIKQTLQNLGWTEDQINTINWDPEYCGFSVLTTSDLKNLSALYEKEGEVVLACGLTVCSIILSDGTPMLFVDGHMQSTMCESSYRLNKYLERLLK